MRCGQFCMMLFREGLACAVRRRDDDESLAGSRDASRAPAEDVATGATKGKATPVETWSSVGNLPWKTEICGRLATYHWLAAKPSFPLNYTTAYNKYGDEKRRNYSEEEDVMLLRQVLGDRPFQAQRGKITGAWMLSPPSSWQRLVSTAQVER
ncbi:hypothetical protein GQ600_18715 [Phytophthora cactorum]|nr:hypothetical protein GQ600_18715 [Phytophthora cactorum]